MMSSVFSSSVPTQSHAGASASSDHNNLRFEDELYTTYLQARSGRIPISSTGLLGWAQEIAVSEGYFDRDEAAEALTAEWLEGWCQRYNVSDVDAAESGAEAESEVDEEEEVDDEPRLQIATVVDNFPKPIVKPADPPEPNTNDIESIINTYLTTPQPRSKLYEHMLAESASKMLMKFMNEKLHMADDMRPEHLQPDELNRTIVQFFRQLYRSENDGQQENYSVRILHGILEGLSRYLRGNGYSSDLAYDSTFSEARAAFGDRLSEAFDLESKQKFVETRPEMAVENVETKDVTNKLLSEHKLRPLGSEEIAPDEAMASFNKNTQKVMTWAAKNVVAFARERLAMTQFTRVEEMPPVLLNIVLTRFFCEARKADGTEFGWNSFKSVFSNLEAYLRVHRYPLGLHDPIFKMAKQTLFNVLRPGNSTSGVGAANANNHSAISSSTHVSNQNRSLSNQGLSSGVDPQSSARPLYHRPIEINSAEESVMWSQGAFGWHSPQAINTTLYYYMRHIYGVRSGESHRRINFGDLKTMKSEDGREEFLVYTKAASGVDMSRLRRMWATRDDRCIVRVYKVMVAKRPPETRKPDAPLYLQPKRQRNYNLDANQIFDSSSTIEDMGSGSDYWFTTAPLGKNALATLMREAHQSCGLDVTRIINGNNTSNNNVSTSNTKRSETSNPLVSNNNNFQEDDMEHLLADGNNSTVGEDGGSSRSSSSFSFHSGLPQSLVPGQQSRSFTRQASLANGSNRRMYGSSDFSNSSPQNQAIDLATGTSRKRDNLGRFSGANDGSYCNGQQEALSLCTSSTKTNATRPSSAITSSHQSSTSDSCHVNGKPSKVVKMEPKSVNDATSSAFGNGVGNMSITMQPKNVNDMADVLGFLNQFLNSLNGSNSAQYKCNINVTVNISK